MNAVENGDAFFRELECEHHNLDRSVHDCGELLHQAARSPAGEAAPRVIERLQGLYEELTRHFRQEEAGGSLEEAVSRLPRLSVNVNHLLEQHGQLTAQLHAAISAAARAVDAADWRKLADEFQEFGVALRSHESNESRILEQAGEAESE